MNHPTYRWLNSLALTLAIAVPVHAAELLTLENFLDQVQSGSPSIRSANLGAEGAFNHSKEGSLPFTPIASGSVQYSGDKKKNPFFSYQELQTFYSTVGLSQTFRTGTQAKFLYSLSSTEYVGFKSKYFEGRPQIELVQPLWRNWLGAETRATESQLNSAALASHYAFRFQSKAQLAEAETSYWRLVLARESVHLVQDALDRSQKIFEWNSRRARLQLGDTSDLLQAQAALELRRLQFDSAKNDERAASRAFNLARGKESSDVPETLKPAEMNQILSQSLSAMPGTRDDVRSAQKQQLAAQAAATAGIERNSVTVELFGSYALNSRESTSGTAMGHSFGLNQPSSTIGLRASGSLDMGTAGSTRSGYRLEQVAADLNLQRKQLEQQQDWNDLKDRFEQAKNQLKLAQTIESTQESKLKHERDRLSRGRSTTYQVLVFEQDYASAQLTRLQIQATLLQTYSRIRLFQGVDL